jgi:hypothetical protein
MDRTQITATAGPWTGYVLTMDRDQAEQAIADGWAVARSEPPFDMAVPSQEFPELDDETRERALRAALAWHERNMIMR